MEGVEDIPGSVLAEGIDFSWESFPEYLDVLDRAPRAMDIGAQVPHAALRFYVMGDRGADHAEARPPDEIGRDGPARGRGPRGRRARASPPRAPASTGPGDGRLTPSLTAADAELVGIAEAMAAAGAGRASSATPTSGPASSSRCATWPRCPGGRCRFSLLQVDDAPERWRETLGRHPRGQRGRGARHAGQVGVRPIGVLMGLDASVHPFVAHPAYREVAAPAAGRAGGPAARRTRAAPPADRGAARPATPGPSARSSGPSSWATRPTTSPTRPASIGARARAAGRDPYELVLRPAAGRRRPGAPAPPVRELHRRRPGRGAARCWPTPTRSPGSATAGPTWARSATPPTRRSCSPTGAGTAPGASGCRSSCSSASRRRCRPGLRACATGACWPRAAGRPQRRRPRRRCACTAPRDAPRPAGRRQAAGAALDGYRHTFVAGVEVARDGELTGARPGRLVRGRPAGARPDPTGPSARRPRPAGRPQPASRARTVSIVSASAAALSGR